MLLVVGLLGLTTGCQDKGKNKNTSGSSGKSSDAVVKKLDVTMPDTTDIAQGKEVKITVKIKRTEFNEAVDVELDKATLPKGVTVEDASQKIEKDKTEAHFTLKAAADAEVKDGTAVKITGKSGDLVVPNTFKVNVKAAVLAKLEVTLPGATNITQGKEVKITIKIKRVNFSEAVDVELDKTTLPKGVTVEDASQKIEKDKTEAHFTLKAAADAEVKDGTEVKITGKSGALVVPNTFKVNVKKS
jgi:hypothetical protein